MKLEYDKLLSNSAFNCNLRHYMTEKPLFEFDLELPLGMEVGRCRLTPG